MEALNRLSDKLDGALERLTRIETKLEGFPDFDARLRKIERLIYIGLGIVIVLNILGGFGIWAFSNFDIAITPKS